MFDARRLRVLAAVADHRSFTRAAETLAMTQPAVSRQIAALEREVGAQLVVRGPRHVALTPAGAALADDAGAIIAAVDAAARRVRGSIGDDGGAIRLGAVPSALAGVVPDALEALRAARPRVDVLVEEGWSADLMRLTSRGDLDAAVIAAPAGGGPAPGDLLVREPFAALLPAGHPLGRRRRLALADLAGEPWLVAPGPGGRAAVLAACAAAGFTPRISGTAAWDATARLVGIGVGVALAPRATAARLARQSSAVARPLDDEPARELRLLQAPRARRTLVERDLESCLRRAASSPA